MRTLLQRGLIALVICMVVYPAYLAASQATIPNTFTNGTPADADLVNANFTALKTAIDDNDTRLTRQGSTFIRYGSAVAPTGTTLVYSGLVFGTHYTQSGGDLLVLQSGDPGAAATQGHLLYPAKIQEVGPGMTAGTALRAAVCHAPAPTMVIWGTHTAPAGWTVLYRGYAMGNYFGHAPTAAPICVDTDAYDASILEPGTNAALLYPVSINTPPTNATGYTAATFLKCAVIMKD